MSNQLLDFPLPQPNLSWVPRSATRFMQKIVLQTRRRRQKKNSSVQVAVSGSDIVANDRGWVFGVLTLLRVALPNTGRSQIHSRHVMSIEQDNTVWYS